MVRVHASSVGPGAEAMRLVDMALDLEDQLGPTVRWERVGRSFEPSQIVVDQLLLTIRAVHVVPSVRSSSSTESRKRPHSSMNPVSAVRPDAVSA